MHPRIDEARRRRPAKRQDTAMPHIGALMSLTVEQATKIQKTNIIYVYGKQSKIAKSKYSCLSTAKNKYKQKNQSNQKKTKNRRKQIKPNQVTRRIKKQLKPTKRIKSNLIKSN